MLPGKDMVRTFKDIFLNTREDKESLPSLREPAHTQIGAQAQATHHTNRIHVSTNHKDAMTPPVHGSDATHSNSPTQPRRHGGEESRHKWMYQKLRTKHRRVHRQKSQLMRDYAELKIRKDETELRYNHLVEHSVRPYAQKRKLPIDEKSYKSMDFVLKCLTEDAMQAVTLNGRCKVAKEQIYAQKREIQLSHEQIAALQHELASSRAEVQTLQCDLRGSRAHTGPTQNQVQLLEAQLQDSRKQVHGLQKQMFAGLDKVNVVTDDQFAQEFRALVALVKSLGRSVHVHQGVDVIATLNPSTLHKGTFEHHWTSRRGAKLYIESWVWSTLIKMVFKNPFQIFGRMGMALEENWVHMFEGKGCTEWPQPDATCEAWRCTTIEQLVNVVGEEVVTAGNMRNAPHGTLSDTAKQLTRYVVEAREDVANTLGSSLVALSSVVDVSRIPHIVNKAFTLGLRMSLQRCRLQVTFPKPGAEFVKSKMEALHDGDGNDMAGEQVAFIVHPGLTKWGDANGRKLDQRYDIVSSLVQLKSMVVKREAENE